MKTIDLRSDTVTRPTAGMREAMMSAPLGDDTLGDEPTVRRLEERVAEITGKEAAVFVPSGTMANLIGLAAQTRPGDAVIAHKDSHFYHYEAGGYAAVAGVNPRLVDAARGIFGPAEAAALMPHRDPHFSQVSLLWIENTMNRGGGAVWPMERLREIAGFAGERGLRLHMDGARVWNAAVALGVAVHKITEHADSVSCCFSKGLGCPAGSAFCSDAATVERARRLRKMLGGSMRQSGVLAGAALYALEHHFERLAEDHQNARLLAEWIAETPGLSCDATKIETNMVRFSVEGGAAGALCERLEERGVRMLAESATVIRAVCHLDVSEEDVVRAAGVIGEVMGGTRHQALGTRH
jgi:threonine aldolase